MKLFFIVFGAVLSALFVFGVILAVPYVMEKKEEVKGEVAHLKSLRGKFTVISLTSEAEFLDMKARSVKTEEDKAGVIAEVDRLKAEYKTLSAEFPDQPHKMRYAGEIIKAVDQWTAEWRRTP